MTEANKVHNLFPTPIWVSDLDAKVHEPMNRAILANLEAMMGERPPVKAGGTLQTDNDLHTFEAFADLTQRITSTVEGVLRFLEIDYSDFEITGCWANINPPGGINTPHMHPNNYLSGVYYVQTGAGADSIFFADPRPQASMILPRTKRENIYSANQASIEAKPGRMIVFPAWLVHGVPANRSQQDRVSVSFNAMFSSFTETMSAPLWKPTAPLKRETPVSGGGRRRGG